MDVLTISLGRNILKHGSRERERMHLYAQYLNAFHVVVLTRKEHGFGNVVHENNLHLYPTNSHSRIMMLWDAFVIGRGIAKQKRTESLVISAQDPLEIGWLCWFLSRIQNTTLHTQVHGDYFSGETWVGGSLIRRLRRRAALVLLRLAPRIRVVSERIKKSLIQKGIASEKITVLPIRPELESFLHTPHVFKEKSPYTFLYVGRLAPEKDIPRILYAFAELHSEHPQAHLRIVGDGEERVRIVSLIKLLNLQNSVSLVSWTEDVQSEMAKADVFLLASKHESYGLVLVEAMAAGLPIVTTDVGCVGEVMKNEIHGIVVYEDDVTTYARAMERMVTDTEFRRSCGVEGRKTAQILACTTPDEYAQTWVIALI